MKFDCYNNLRACLWMIDVSIYWRWAPDGDVMVLIFMDFAGHFWQGKRTAVISSDTFIFFANISIITINALRFWLTDNSLWWKYYCQPICTLFWSKMHPPSIMVGTESETKSWLAWACCQRNLLWHWVMYSDNLYETCTTVYCHFYLSDMTRSAECNLQWAMARCSGFGWLTLMILKWDAELLYGWPTALSYIQMQNVILDGSFVSFDAGKS